MSYFSFPKKYKDGEDAVDFTITLKASKMQPDGSYKDIFKEVTSSELKNYVDAAVKRGHTKELFVSTEISKKLVREFTSNAGKKLAAVSVPVYENGQNEKAVFYDIVVPVERIKSTDNESMVTLSLFRKGTNGEDYTLNAKRSVPVPGSSNEYKDVSIKMSSAEVIKHFETSKQRYRETHQNNSSNRTLADELEDTHSQREQTVNENSERSNRRSGR